MTLDQLASRTASQFSARFGSAPRWIVAAPGRVNLIGEHTDYNDGFVLPMAIECWTVIAGRPIPEPRGVMHSEQIGSSAQFDLTQPQTPGEPHWANYVRGVIAGFQRLGITVGGFEAALDSTVPFGSGLSSSAALEVATATLLEAATGHALVPVEKALLCQRAEQEFAGVPCGIMDQFTSALAEKDRLLLLDCRSHQVQLVTLTDPSVAVLIINTNVRHELGTGEYARRRAQCETAAGILGVPALRDVSEAQLRSAQGAMDPVVYRRARHVVSEIGRTLSAAKAITESDWPLMGRLMAASHASLRDDYEVSCPELDAVVSIAESIGPAGGVLGCRMTGGGFGGCAVSLVQANTIEALKQRIGEAYHARTGLEATIFVSRPAAGARVLSSA